MCECNSIYKHGKVKCPKGSCAELRGRLSPTNRVFPVLGNAVVGQTQKRLVKMMAKYGGHTCSPSLRSQASQAGGDLRAESTCFIKLNIDSTIHLSNGKHRRNLQFIAAPYHMMPAVYPYGTSLLLQLLQLKGMTAGWKLTEQGDNDVRGKLLFGGTLKNMKHTSPGNPV